MSESSKIVIAGAGGHAAVVVDACRSSGRWNVVALTDPQATGSLLGVPIMGTDEVLPSLLADGVTAAVVGVGSVRDCSLRTRLFERLVDIGFSPSTIVHGAATVSESAIVGEGTVVLATAVVNALTRLGRNCIVNTGAIIEHGCIVGDHVHLAPGCVVAGGVSVGSGAHVGAGAVVLEGRTIGSRAVVGAGAVVTHDVDDGVVVTGIPARPRR